MEELKNTIARMLRYSRIIERGFQKGQMEIVLTQEDTFELLTLAVTAGIPIPPFLVRHPAVQAAHAIPGEVVSELTPAQDAAITEWFWGVLPVDPEHEDRRRTGQGTKTKLGLLRTMQRIVNAK